MCRGLFYSATIFAFLITMSSVQATPVAWTTWNTATASNGNIPGSASGTILFGSTAVTVNYSGELDSNTEVAGAGTNYITPLTTYTSTAASNAPPGGNLITVTGGTSFTDTVTFSSPIQNFLMAFVSLGNPGTAVTYQFNSGAPISILSTGTGSFGGNINLLSSSSGGLDTVTGQESDGVIQFGGSFSSISWTIPPPGEYWDGWTFGAVSQAVPEPASMGLLAVFAAALLSRRPRPKHFGNTMPNSSRTAQ